MSDKQEDFTEHADRLNAVEIELTRHPGRIAYSEWNGAKRMVLVFRKNVDEILHLIDSVEHDEMAALELAQNVRPTGMHGRFIEEFDRVSFNMHASLSAVVDYLRTLVSSYSDTDLEREFSERNGKVGSSPLGVFMKSFRNYLMHVGLPTVSTSYSFKGPASPTQGEWSMNIYFSTTLLRQRGTWPSQAKQFLDSQGERLNIGNTIREYAKEVTLVHDWLFGKFEELHGADMDSYGKLVDRRNKILTGA